MLFPLGVFNDALKWQLWACTLCKWKGHDLRVLMWLTGSRLWPAIEVGQSTTGERLHCQLQYNLKERLLTRFQFLKQEVWGKVCDTTQRNVQQCQDGYLHSLPSSAQICSVKRICLWLERPCDADEMVGNDIEFVQQQSMAV